MKLRTLVLIGFSAVLIVVIAAGVVTVRAQRSQLYDQVDDRLTATPLPPETREPPLGIAPDTGVAPETGAAAQRGSGQPVDTETFSDTYVAVVQADRSIRPVIVGPLLDDVPDLTALTDTPPDDTTILTMAGVGGASTFRVLYLPASNASFPTVVAVPVDDVDATIEQLTYILVATAGIVLLALLAIAWWLNRFGLRPIAEMTDVAEAISAGERDRRAPVRTESTEAGRLGHAFNVMLDERDVREERLRQFVSNASHELRTPLTSIRGYLDLYAAGGFRKPGELDDAIRRLQGEADRMGLLVEDLLVLAKLDEEQPLDIGEMRLDHMLQDVVALALAAHPDRRIDLTVPSDLVIEADRLRLHQAVVVLVDNAIRHTPSDTDIEVMAAAAEGHTEISVIDTGPGLSADEVAAVFDRFSRGDRSRARRSGGSGLGLSIAQAIVRAHGGDITLRSAPGDGATFTIELPANSH